MRKRKKIIAQVFQVFLESEEVLISCLFDVRHKIADPHKITIRQLCVDPWRETRSHMHFEIPKDTFSRGDNDEIKIDSRLKKSKSTALLLCFCSLWVCGTSKHDVRL